MENQEKEKTEKPPEPMDSEEREFVEGLTQEAMSSTFSKDTPEKTLPNKYEGERIFFLLFDFGWKMLLVGTTLTRI